MGSVYCLVELKFPSARASRQRQQEYDPLTTLLWEDVRERKVVVDGATVTALAFKIKSPKVDKVGTGDLVEVYWTGGFSCPVTAFQRWRRASKVEEHPKMPVFRLTQGCCYTGQQLNKSLQGLQGSMSRVARSPRTPSG